MRKIEFFNTIRRHRPYAVGGGSDTDDVGVCAHQLGDDRFSLPSRPPQGLRASIVTGETPWPPRLASVTMRTELPEMLTSPCQRSPRSAPLVPLGFRFSLRVGRF